MIPLNNSIFKSFIALDFIRKKRFAFFKTLQKLKYSQYYPEDKLKEIQIRKLKQLVQYSYENVPYYHRLFKQNGVHPNDIKSLEDLKKIPVLTKKKIQNNMDKMISIKKSRNNLLKNYTGGSTGKPLTFYQCYNYLNYAQAGKILAWYIIPGFDYGTRTALLWSAHRDIRSNQSLLYQIKKYLDGTVTMNANKINDIKLEIFIKYIDKFKPFILRGYPSILCYLAKYIDKHQIDIPDISCVITTAEVLHEDQREKLAKVFKCHILNSYGCREVSQIAMECPKHNGLHVMMENQIVELLDTNEDVVPTEIGSVVVTNLNNYGMPFIRYEVEDMARRSSIDKCGCNRGLSLIDNIIGREKGFIITPNGNNIYFGYFEMKFYGFPGVEEYQVIQEELDKIVILVVGDIDRSKDKMEELRKEMMTELGEHIQIEVEYVDQIKRSDTGKYQRVISKVH